MLPLHFFTIHAHGQGKPCMQENVKRCSLFFFSFFSFLLHFDHGPISPLYSTGRMFEKDYWAVSTTHSISATDCPPPKQFAFALIPFLVKLGWHLRKERRKDRSVTFAVDVGAWPSRVVANIFRKLIRFWTAALNLHQIFVECLIFHILILHVVSENRTVFYRKSIVNIRNLLL